MTSVDVGKVIEHLGRIQNSSAENAVRKACYFVQSAAKTGAPVQDGELRRRIVVLPVQVQDGVARGIVQSNSAYGLYVEMGTGPRGAASHEGISPDVDPTYTMSPWWIHEGPGENEVDRETGERYGWYYIDTKEGRFYQCTGQAAHPYMYPALHDNREKIREIFLDEVKKNL